MKHEVKLDQQALADVLHREYGLEVAQFTYFPQGEVGINYILTCRDGERHFLKLYPGSRLARWSIGRLDFTLALTRALFDRGLLDRLAYPIPTRHGELKAAFQGMPLILYNYIPGENLMDRYPYSLAVLEQAAGLIASLHNSTPHLGLEVPFVDDFTAHFEAELRRELDALGTVSSSARPGQQALRDLIFPQRQLVLGLVDEMHQLAERVHRLPLEPVICHTDANQANLIMAIPGSFTWSIGRERCWPRRSMTCLSLPAMALTAFYGIIGASVRGSGCIRRSSPFISTGATWKTWKIGWRVSCMKILPLSRTITICRASSRIAYLVGRFCRMPSNG